MANIIKKVFFDFIDKSFSQYGQVLNIRKWQPESIYEIDLHLPRLDMDKWEIIPKLRIKVAEFEYRDYSPAVWDAGDKICTLYVETGHQGLGSKWVKNLNVGDTILCGAANTANLPSTEGRILCFGDGSALGHFMALKSMTNATKNPLDVTIFLNREYHIPESLSRAYPEFKFIMSSLRDSLTGLLIHAESLDLTLYSSIFIAGNIPMVQGLRKKFKSDSKVSARIFANGFWS